MRTNIEIIALTITSIARVDILWRPRGSYGTYELIVTHYGPMGPHRDCILSSVLTITWLTETMTLVRKLLPTRTDIEIILYTHVIRLGRYIFDVFIVYYLPWRRSVFDGTWLSYGLFYSRGEIKESMLRHDGIRPGRWIINYLCHMIGFQL